jgi:hypothetical protein
MFSIAFALLLSPGSFSFTDATDFCVKEFFKMLRKVDRLNSFSDCRLNCMESWLKIIHTRLFPDDLVFLETMVIDGVHLSPLLVLVL